MANKKNCYKRRKKREIKKVKSQIMANCRRVAAARSGNESIFREEFDTQVMPVDPITESTIADECVLPDEPTSAVLTNVGDSNEGQNINIDNTAELQTDNRLSPERNSQECKQLKQQKQVTKKSSTSIHNLLVQNSDHNYDAKERLVIVKLYFFEKLKTISNHAPHFGCNLTNLDITGEAKKGLHSKLKFTCNMCKAELFVDTSDPRPTENLDINTAAVSGISNAGIGLEQFQGLCAAMNLPTLTQQMYAKKHTEICEQWEKTAHEIMAAAAERERLAAIEEGRVKDGIAVIDVIADACWSKRSYKKNYSALSGAAAIVGRKFGEVLFLGVKNKYCCICARAQNKGTSPKEHTCYKNYTGASSGMEAEIIAEAFKNSVDMYNVIYGRVIADGDSNTYAKILQERPYKNVTVEKIECRNHVLRNMCNKLTSVSTDTKYPLVMRKMLTTQRILAIRKVICSAIKKHKNDDTEKALGVKINRLYTDISNSCYHAFGHHSDCLDHYCCSEKKSEDLLPKIKCSTFWARIQYIVGIVATHSRSLINDCDSNAVEQFNSIVAKFVGGKRTNLIQRQTYQSRCAAAVVAYNTKRPLYTLQKSLLGKSPQSKTKAFEIKRLQKNILKKGSKPNKKIDFSIKPSKANIDKYYGTGCQKPDMSKDMYEKEKAKFLKNIVRTDSERSKIEEDTILQRNSSEWLELRRNMLTASNFGKVIKRRPTTTASIVKSLLYKSCISHIRSIKHGIDNEPIALKQLAVQEGLTIKSCGLFIDSQIPFLAATPDGLIGDDTIVEIKCPLSAFKMPFEKAVKDGKIKFWNLEKDKMVINKNDSWYYQVQGQLHITKRKMCLFAVWLSEAQKITTETIYRDDEFWKSKMEGKLTDFYTEHILPELIDPRVSRNMKLRGPMVATKRQLKTSTEARSSKLARQQSDPETCHLRSDTPSTQSPLETVSSNLSASAEPLGVKHNVLSITEY